MSSPQTSVDHAPYPGLRPFRFDEAGLFYGRGKHIAAMIKILRKNSFLAVIGSSGSGKSSLVRAGLLPALGGGYLGGPEFTWRFVDLRPGGAPFVNLAKALARVATNEDEPDPEVIERRVATLLTGPGGLIEAIDDSLFPENTRVLVLIDQFEELFRFAARLRKPGAPADVDSRDNPLNEAVAFVNQLLWTINARDPRVFVVLTMRSDFLGDCDVFQNLPEAITQSQFLTPQLTRGELTDAIERPMGEGGIDPAVTARLLNAIRAPIEAQTPADSSASASHSGTSAHMSRPTERDAGSTVNNRQRDVLPLLQHALLRMWQLARTSSGPDGPRIKADHYELSGGFENALSLHASEIYQSLSPGGEDTTGQRRQWIAQRMFTSLCQTGGEGRRVRRLATVRQIAAEAGVAPGDVIAVAEKFVVPGVNFIVATPPGPLTADTTLDISHESLIRQWGLLRGWLQEEEVSAAQYQRLLSSARLHAAEIAEPMSARELAQVEDWIERRKPTAAWADRYGPATFAELVMPLIDVSRAAVKTAKEAAERRTLEAAKQRERELYQARFLANAANELAEARGAKAKQLQRLSYAIAIALLIAAGGAIYATQKRSEAIAAQKEAEVQAKDALFAKKEAEDQRQLALESATRLEMALNVAETAKRDAEVQKQNAIDAATKLELVLKEAETAKREAVDAKGLAEETLGRQLQMYSWPTTVCGEIAGGVANHDSESVLKSFSQFENSANPFAFTQGIRLQIRTLGEAIARWQESMTDESGTAVNRAALGLAVEFRRAWERESERLSDAAKLLSKQLIVEPTYKRALNVAQTLTQTPNDPAARTELEQLYWGELVFLETPDVESAMVNLRKELRGDQKGLESLSSKLERAIETALTDVKYYNPNQARED